MKKISLLVVTFLVLVSSIIFCGCDNKYKNLKIKCDTEQISLVLDDEKLSMQNIVFELSGAKSWGEISIVSQPLGLVHAEYQIKDKKCGVVVKALQPSGEGATLVIKHLGSGKSLSVPLNIGRKLQTVASAGKDFIIQTPEIDEVDGVKQIEIPTKQLLSCYPANYTDTIVWQSAELSLPDGVKLESYDANNNLLTSTFNVSGGAGDEADAKVIGTSSAIKTTLVLTAECESDTTFTINPISILDGKAILHKDVAINICIMNLLSAKDIELTSSTHGNSDGILKDLVLISNPDPNKPREDASYDYYSTAIIDLKQTVDNLDGETVLKDLISANAKYADLYQMELSTNIDALRLENVDFGKIRAIASSTCIGEGTITVKFVPNECVGDVKEFSIEIPCLVGERATSFTAQSNGNAITINKEDNYTFNSMTPLNDSNSLGQAFKFDILSTHTLSALRGYKISINANLMYIDSKTITTDDSLGIKTSEYIKDLKNNPVDLTNILLNNYEYQISLLRDGKNISFNYDEVSNTFVSETLSAKSTIYIKWIKNATGTPLGNTYFGVSLTNFYDESYDIANNGFDRTVITYNLAFDRQRTVESISYVPVQVVNDAGWIKNEATPDNNWQFYFTPEMFESTNNFYGLYISQVLGLNGTLLTVDELSNIDLEISIAGVNLGFALFNRDTVNVDKIGGGFDYTPSYTFNYDSKETDWLRNIVVIGKTDDIEYGDYEISISQNNRAISSRNLRVYKNLDESDVKITVPSADFKGEYLAYQKLSDRPDDWSENWSEYYEYAGGQYAKLTNGTWNNNKAYFKKVDVNVLIKGEAQAIDLDSTYILSTSKQYIASVEVSNEDFVNLSGQSVTAKVVAGISQTLGDGYAAGVCVKDAAGNHIIRTGQVGSFDNETKQNNYIQLTYTVKAKTYDYYKLNEDTDSEIAIEKIIYIFVYEPLISASFEHSMVYKYDIDSLPNDEFKQQYGKQTLNIKLNNGNTSVLNYVDIQWKLGGDGIDEVVVNSKDKATYTFATRNTTITSSIVATLTQYGIQYPIYCGYQVSKPILSEQVILNNNVHSFKSGDPYISLKVGEKFNIDATATSSAGSPSIEGFEYVICSTTGYKIDSVATVDTSGVLTAQSAGRVKLVVIAKDIIQKDLSSVINYFETSSYLYHDAYVMIDVLVADGSAENPYLIADLNGFKDIVNDYYYTTTDDAGNTIKINANGDTSKTNDYHYALVSDIDLNGIAINLNNFDGTITSFQESETSSNRFKIFGVMLNETNQNLFTLLNARDDDLPNLSNIDFYIDINYIASEVSDDKILIGLVGTNDGLIHNITITVNGTINANNIDNDYIIGSISAKNLQTIKIDNPTLVGVQGSIVVENSTTSTVILGGVIGQNEGALIGCEPVFTSDDEVKYEVYYDNQGATADVELQVKGVGDLNNSAIGGAIGYNIGSSKTETIDGLKVVTLTGTMTNVYSTGKVLGIDGKKALKVDNVGGLIGKNTNSNIIYSSITTGLLDSKIAVSKVSYATSNFQITNSYSSAQVAGKDNVGGAVGSDVRGSYKKVYYEIYFETESIKGNNNVGGLIGKAEDSNLYYCYANSFAWGYKTKVDVYDITGNTNVGGLVGLATSSRLDRFDKQDYTYSAMNIVSSLASVSIKANSQASGLVGRLNNYGAIYTAYFYGIIDTPVPNPITQIYKSDSAISNVAYNNAYSIIANISLNQQTMPQINQVYTEKDGVVTLISINGFAINHQYNNGKPHIIYRNESGYITNLVSIIPTAVQINKAFEDYYNKNTMFTENNLGDYVLVAGEYVVYEPNNDAHNGLQRYSLMASLVDTADTTGNLSDYRTKALVLYYYQFSDMSGEQALTDMYSLNTVDMHDIVNDDGIIVLPNTFKRFNLSSSDLNIVSVLTGGKLLLKKEGQVTITLTSILNPSAKASFVVIVRSKVLKFGLYSNANLRYEYNISGKTINIVKETSKLIYTDYSSTVQVYNRGYKYNPATNMEVDFTITYSGTDESLVLGTKKISDYITLNGVYNEEAETYTVPYGTPITISVKEHVDGNFTITATPYVMANYQNGEYTNKVRTQLSSYFKTSFDVVTRQGASAINVNKTQLDMMPSDEASKLDVKINTDIKVNKLYLDVSVLGDKFETEDIDKPGEFIKFVDMLDISCTYINEEDKTITALVQVDKNGLYFDISSSKLQDMLQNVSLTFKLNKKSYYVDEAFRLQVRLFVMNNVTEIDTIMHINVRPQEMSSLVALNYRMKDIDAKLSLDNAYLSEVIRPGNINIITIDITPNIAIYDYVEIVDTTNADKILLQQVNKDLSSLENMDTWVDNGIKLTKYKDDIKTSKLYVLARLPLYATANITHTLQITAFDKNGVALKTTQLNLEAVMYPTIVMTYTYPNGDTVVADTREGNAQQERTAYADLAVGVEASIGIATYNIDEDSLKYNITIKDEDNNVIENNNLVSLQYLYGKYVLKFNTRKQAEWFTLIGNKIDVTFTAHRKLNGITETCSATIEFNIKRMVIHGISMTHTNSNGQLYGDWDESFNTQFYFDKTDISYYNEGYWNTQYTIDNTKTSAIVDARLRKDIGIINSLLVKFNTVGVDVINIYLANINDDETKIKLKSNYNEDGISITNKNFMFVIKAEEDSSINSKKLIVEYKLSYDVENYPKIDAGSEVVLSNEFGFSVTPKSGQFDEYLTVSSQEEFENMLEGKYYRLTTPLTFTNYSPINTAIGGFTGDGHTITIASFNESQLIQNYISSGMQVGLFGTLAENSVVQNLQVRYDNIIFNLDNSQQVADNHTNSIYYGGIAGINLGVITNVKVSGVFKLLARQISPELINLGGICAINGSSESTKVAAITGSTVSLEMSAMALIGGVSGTNYGKITNTNFKGKITSNDSNEYASNIFTAGFVVNNLSNGYISLSYVDCGLGANVYNIHSVGRTAGFVFSNAGSISNSYINQTAIRSQGNIGGFVYQSSGYITNCYAYSTLGNSLFYQEFIYSSDNIGKLTNCYVVTDSDQNISVSGLKAVKPMFVSLESSYNGFIFAERENGVWTISDNGPTLLSSGFNDNPLEYSDIYNIYDLATFEHYFNPESDIIEGKTYRIVRDIDFEDRSPITFSKTLKTSIEGNDMALTNYNIYKVGDVESIGLFANIESIGLGVYVRNLILQPSNLKATGSIAVGALAGTIDSANIYNIKIDNSSLLMLGKNAVGGLAGIIKGDFEVIGISSNISVFATYAHNLGGQYNLYTGKNVTGLWAIDNIQNVSYAGSVAGIVNGYNIDATPSMENRNINNYYTISDIEISGDVVLVGETVGGAFGLVGETTLAKNIIYNLSGESVYQAVHVAGGLVGENRGIIENAHIYAYDETTAEKKKVDTSNCFDKFAKLNGGIVGVNIGGLVYNSTSNIDVCTTVDLSTAGGIVGQNIEGSVYNCSVSGSLRAYFMGGIIGTDYTYNTIIKQETGNGTATPITTKVYNNIKNPINYINCITDYNEDMKFKSNIITNEFINNIIKNPHHIFNPAHINNPANHLITANVVFGLVVGLTDGQYSALTASEDAVNCLVKYSKAGLDISLVNNKEPDDARKEYELRYNNKTFISKPISNIVAPNLDLGLAYPDESSYVLFLYLIAYDNASYNSWSSTLGYSNQHIAISNEALTEKVEEPETPEETL